MPTRSVAALATTALAAGLLIPLATVPANSAGPTEDPPTKVTKRDIDRAVKALPGRIRSTMKKTGVPGLAVAVVHKNRLLYKDGFGIRNTEGSGKVKPKTVFQLASVSKSLSSSVVAGAISKGDVKWDTLAADHVPGFTLADPWVTDHVSVGDLFSHRTGLPGGTGDDLEAYGFDRSTIIDRMRYEPLSPFRISYSYSNFGLTTGGQAVADAMGMPWEKVGKKMIFKPLGMKHSTYSHAEFVDEKKTAALHQQVNGKWFPSAKRNADAQAPAGGASSNVLDLSRWLRMMLAQGKFDGERIVKRSPLRKALSLQIRTSPPANAALQVSGYGFGMDVGTDASGRVRWSHSGAFSAGAATRIMMIPSLKLGIVILTNGWPIGVPEALAQDFGDLVEYGSVQEDWLAQLRPMFAQYTVPSYEIDGKPRPKNPDPARPADAYLGTYRNDYVGTATVVRKGSRLELHVGPAGQTVFPLRHWSGDTYFYNSIDSPPGFWTALTFSGTGPKGEATDMDIAEVNSGLGAMQRVQN